MAQVAMNVGGTYDDFDVALPRIRWGAIIAGIVTALVIQMMLVVLGLGIGVVASESIETFAIGTAIWVATSAAVAAFCGGWMASRVAGCVTRDLGGLCGLITGMTLLLLLSSFVVSLAFQAVGQAIGLVGSVAGTGAQVVTGQVVQGPQQGQEVQNRLASAARALGLEAEYQALSDGMSESSLRRLISENMPELAPQHVDATVRVVHGVLGEAQTNITSNLNNPAELLDVFRQQRELVETQLSGAQLVNRLQTEGVPPADAARAASIIEARVNQLAARMEQTAEQISTQAREVADTATEGISTAAWSWLAFALIVIGLAWFGGAVGVLGPQDRGPQTPRRQRVEERVFPNEEFHPESRIQPH